MSKAILILEMPDRCGHCRLSAIVKYYAMCMVTGLECTETGKPEWCPLREVPDRIRRVSIIDLENRAEKNGIEPAQQNWFDAGWNDCLDAIGGAE